MKWLKFIRLSSPDKLLFLKIAFLLLVTRFGLPWVPYKMILKHFAWLSKTSSDAVPSSESERRYLDTVVLLTNAAGRRILGSKPCLPKALVVECLLKRRGIDASLRIGVTKSVDDELLAHAWVEHNGDIVIGGRLSEARYARLRSLKPEAS